MPLSPKNKQAVEDIEDLRGDLNRALDLVSRSDSDEEVIPLFARLRDALGEMLQKIPLEATKTDLRSFFDDVGESIIQAQEDLDERSEDYIRYAADHDHVQPSVFRIPKASAQFQFAMEKGTGRRFNLFVFSSESSERTRMQHSVSFDVVASPPPPDLLARQQEGGDIPIASYRLGRRRELAELIDAAPVNPNQVRFKKHLVENIDQALVLTDSRRYAVLLPADVEDKIDIAFIDEPADPEHLPEVKVGRFNPHNTPSLVPNLLDLMLAAV